MNELPFRAAPALGLSSRVSSSGGRVRRCLRYLLFFFFCNWKRNQSLLCLHSPCCSHASAFLLCPSRRSICSTVCSGSPVSQATHPGSQWGTGKPVCIYIIWMGSFEAPPVHSPVPAILISTRIQIQAPTADWNLTMNKWCVPSAGINYLVLMPEQNSLSV